MPALVLSTTVLPYVVTFHPLGAPGRAGQDYVRTATAKGLARSARRLRPCAAQRADSGGQHHWLARAAPGRRRGRHRGRLRLAGMGRLAVEAADGRDYPLIVGITVVVAAVVVVSSLVVDLAYTWLDPRIRLA